MFSILNEAGIYNLEPMAWPYAPPLETEAAVAPREVTINFTFG